MLITKRLSMTIRKKKIIENISFELRSGEIGILVGPNGAGKTTTINCIIGTLNCSGEAYIDGYKNNSIEAKKVLGYVPEVAEVYDYLTISEHLQFIAKAYKLKNWEKESIKLLERFDLTEHSRKIGKELSKGMKQKLNICCALLIKPKVIIFDEPFVGLDIFAIQELKEIMKELKNEGCTILISTHILESVEELWDKAIVISGGVLLSEYEKSALSGQKQLEDIFMNLKIKMEE